jgi:hypothetical protein
MTVPSTLHVVEVAGCGDIVVVVTGTVPGAGLGDGLELGAAAPGFWPTPIKPLTLPL